MKKFLIGLLYALICNSLFAGTATVTGVVIDGKSQKPVDFVNVALFSKGSDKMVKGSVSKQGGQFVFNSVTEGEYEIRISFVGYNTLKRQVQVKEGVLNLGKLVMSENSQSLKEVEVVGQGTQVKFDVDKKIYSVDQSIATAGGAASDVLKNIPSVKVDNDGNVSLRNDANVEVWINGKPSGLNADNRAQVLQQLPAESVQAIEVMTNPSAKYNPEGTAGIINIVLKKTRKAGYYGSVSSGLFVPQNTGVTPTFGANINYSNSKITAYANVGYRGMKSKGEGHTERTNTDGDDLISELAQQSVTTNKRGGIMARGGIDFRPDTLNTFGLSAFTLLGSGNSSNDINYYYKNYQLSTRNFYNRDNYGTGYMRNYTVNFDYQHDFSKSENVQASVEYSRHNRGSDNEIAQYDSLRFRTLDFAQHSESNNDEFVIKLDYSKKFSSTSRFDAGWQTTFSHRFSSASADSIDGREMTQYKNDFDYYEQIHAGYLTYGNRFWDKLSLQAGLRGEFFTRHSQNETVTGIEKVPVKNKFNLFPSFFLSYELAKGNELQLNITRRINRPRGRQINPFVDRSSYGSVSYGWPGLQPEYAMAYELNFIKTMGDHSLSATAYYRAVENGIENIHFKDKLDLLEYTYMNLSKRQSSGGELVLKNRLLKFISLTSTVNVYYSHINASKSTCKDIQDSMNVVTIAERGTFTWTLNEMLNFMLSKTLSGQITGQYYGRNVSAQGTEYAHYQVDLGLRKTFFNRNLAIGLMVNDVFNTDKSKESTRGTGFYQMDNSYSHRRNIGITATWNFGNSKPKQSESKKRQGGNDMMMDSGMD